MAQIDQATSGGENRIKFLDCIAWSEGTSTSPATKNEGYDVIVSGPDGPEVFTNYAFHPFEGGRKSKLVRPATASEAAIYSSASGRYQLMLHWWLAYKVQLGLEDFSPVSQDKVALQQIRERHALPFIDSGDIESAIAACSSTWASFPNNDYGQPGGKSMQDLVEYYNSLS